MLKDSLLNKTVCIVGIQSVLGKLLIRHLASYLSSPAIIYAIEFKQDPTKKEKFLSDSFFSIQEKQFLKQKITFVPLSQIHKQIETVDILFNFFIPLDFSQFQKAIDYHVIRTNQITQELKKIKQIKKCLMVSSIYCQNPGYLSETEIPQQYVIDLPKNANPQLINTFIKESFSSLRQSWQWSIKHMERSYQRCVENIEIIRVPSLGPTLNNFEGYSDTLNYFTYFVYLMGSSFFESINGEPNNVIDLIPSDYLLNYILLIGSKDRDKKFRVHNLSTSSRNPITIQRLLSFLKEAWEQYQGKQIYLRINSKNWEKNVQKAKDTLPLAVKQRLSQVFDIKQWKIESQQQTIAMKKKQALANKYEYFLTNEWICQSNYSIDLVQELEGEEKKMFPCNVNEITWRTYARLCCFSIKKYLLNQKVEEFKPTNENLLKMKTNNSYFSDVLWALTQGKTVDSVNHVDIKRFILSTKSVKQAIKTLVEERMMKLENEPIAYEKAEQELEKVADQMCTQMFSQYNMRSIRVFAWLLHKIFKTIYEKVVVDKQALLKLRNHNEKQNGPLIIIPTHRSYVDFLIMGYVFFGYGIKLAHIAAAQDFLNMAVVHILLRQSGAFFIKRNQQKNKVLYKAIMEEYISKILADSHYLEFFVEGTRCRVGKMLPPKFGILSIVAKNVLDGKIPDAQILPVTLNYEKVLEGQSFTYEMMGESKVKESLTRLIKAVDTLKENYGRIYIEFCDKISVKNFFKSSDLPYPKTLEKLGYEITYSLSDKLIITAPAILATIVLMNRKGISDDALTQKVAWLCKQINSRGIKIARSQSDSSISISNTMTLLQDIVSKSKKNMFEVQVSLEQQSFIKLFTMTYYRNTLTHIFWNECLIMLALISFGHHNIITKTITIEQLMKETKFLDSLLKKQYVLRHSVSSETQFENVLKLLQNKNVIKMTEDGHVMIGPEGEPTGNNYFAFYGSLIWPIVESYWISCLYLFKLKPQEPVPMEKFLAEIQWFAQSLINERIITHHESISIDTVRNAVGTYTKMGIIKNINYEYNDGTKVSSVMRTADDKVLKNLEVKIEMFLKKSYAKSVKGILESGQGSVNLDFPFLSKL